MATKARSTTKSAKAAKFPVPSAPVTLQRAAAPSGGLSTGFMWVWAAIHIGQLMLIGYFASLIVTDAAPGEGSSLAGSAALIVFILSLPFLVTLVIDVFGIVALQKRRTEAGDVSAIWTIVFLIALVATGMALLAVGLVVAAGLFVNPGFLRG